MPEKAAEPIRVLQVISKPQIGGVETMLMNVYRNIDRSKVQFDFTSHDIDYGGYYDEIHKLGGKVINIKPIREIGVINYIKQIKRVVKENKYTVVHSHISINNAFVLLGAKLGGAKIRISHAHTTTTEKPNTLKYNIVTSIMKQINKMVATKYCACGKLAGEFLYGKKNVQKGKVQIINNAINIDRFKEYYGKKESIKKKYNIPSNVKTVGHIGRFDGPVKNHKFIIKIAEKLKEENRLKDYLFILVGNGENIEKYKKEVKEKELTDNIIFFGISNNIPEVMQLFDVFVLPSLYEGLPVVSVEAQAAGIRSVVSDKVTREIDLGIGLVDFAGINDEDIDDWIKLLNKEEIKLDYEVIENSLKKNGFDISVSVKSFYKLYEEKEK